jgi:alpha-N-acetylglucosamine transferase
MDEELIPIAQFPEGTSRTQVLIETAAQLNKDLGGEWIRMEKIPLDADANWLFNETKLLVNELFNSDRSKLSQLLYRVDVSEREVKKVMETEEINLVADQLAALLVKREVQKVLFRLKIKSGTGL